jgi:adenine-specific DNA-methyltransferase
MNRGVAKRTKKERTETQVLLAQYFTPSTIADYMASLFRQPKGKRVSVLDAGAGEGILGLTLLDAFKKSPASVAATFVELDDQTYDTLRETTAAAQKNHSIELIHDDFINTAFDLEQQGKRFTHIILNPPYFKLRVDSPNNKRLREQNIHVTNIYAAFVWQSARLLEDGGELVAIIPRSFCNGPYFLKFRQFLFDHFSLGTIHIFSSRNKAFAHDSVLQENIILHISKRKQQELVKITYSTDQSFEDIGVRKVPFESIILPADASKTIHIPAENQTMSLPDFAQGALQDLGVSVSTGPIVDFRLKESIKETGDNTTVPLLYPAHMSGHEVEWPRQAFHKLGQHYVPAEAVNSSLITGENEVADKQVLPMDGYYVVVRRFSSKEEKRRIFASVVAPEKLLTKHVTFENHLNYFHAKKHGFAKDLAYGLCAYLNSSIVDEHFRKVSGHTQVNVSDLKSMPYPNHDKLEKIGGIMQSINGLMDDIVKKEVLGTVV